MRLKLLFRFDASNQYYCTPWDWVEEVANCRWLLDRLTR
jgi:hypothetical protein